MRNNTAAANVGSFHTSNAVLNKQTCYRDSERWLQSANDPWIESRPQRPKGFLKGPNAFPGLASDPTRMSALTVESLVSYSW